MSKYDVEIDLEALKSTTEKISKQLLSIDEIIKNVNDAYLSLDDSKWIGNDKKNLDISLGNYLKKMTSFSDELNNTLNVLTTGLSKYDEADQNIEGLEDNVESIENQTESVDETLEDMNEDFEDNLENLDEDFEDSIEELDEDFEELDDVDDTEEL